MKPNENTGKSRRRWMTLAAAALGAAALAAPAGAQAITVSGTAAPADTTAGAHSDFQINVNLGPAGEDVKDLRVGLPPGEVGDPTATPKCTVAQLNANSCPANTQVGTVSSNATVTVILVPVTLNVTGKVFNLEPQPGEPARFGIVLTPVSIPEPLSTVVGGVLPPIILQSGAELRKSDLGLDAIVKDIPNMTAGLPTHINSMTLTLLGMVPAGAPAKPFMRNPTSCTPKTSTLTADSYTNPTPVTAQAPSFTPTNCDVLDFSPTFSATLGAPGLTAAGSKTPLTTVIDQDNEEAGLLRAQVLMPPEVGAQNDQLNETCTEEQFAASSCPANSIVGSAIATSPLLTEPLTGPVALVGAGLPRVGLDLHGPLSMQLFGDFGVVGSATGVTFDGLPDIPISHFELRFSGGPDGLLVAGRNLCEPPAPVFNTNFTGHNGAGTSGATAAVIDGCSAGSNQPGNTGGKGKAKCKHKHGKAKHAKKHHKKCRKKKKKKRR
jgi:hypothetical protein